ncbi:hypothetical protein, partial [Xanthobacter autotrophicus]|uniref:hypothetical protein n=2 Tax=Xanthobacteraceae TaxID=335928 RepID=UPI003727B6AB
PLRRRGDCGHRPDPSGACQRGMVLRFEQEPAPMSSTDAQAFALSLAKTLMVVIVVFRAGDGSLSVVPADEFDGDTSQIVREIDPFAR